jgi:flagellar basal-body rod protein FlgB
MDIGKIPLLEAITRRMSWLGERQSVLAENVANADTPGYVAKDVKPPSFAELVSGAPQKLPLATTNPGDMQPPGDKSGFEVVSPPTGERAPDGNAVSLGAQMMKISDTANDYALTTSLYRQQLGLLKMVLGNGGSG